MKYFGFFIFFFTSFLLTAQIEKQLDSIYKLEGANIQSNAHKIIPILENALQKARAEKNKLAEAKTLSILSLTSYYSGKYDDNKLYALQAIELFDELDEYGLLAKEYGELGYRMKSVDLKNAEKFMMKGVLIAEKHQNKQALSSLYNNYGVIKLQLNQEDSALVYYEKGVDANIQTNNQLGLPYSYNNLGDLYLKKNNFPKAEMYFQKAMDVRQKLNDTYGISDSYAYFGDLYSKQNKHEQAITYFLKSLEIAENKRITNLMQYNYSMLVTCYKARGDYKNALFYADKRQVFGDSLLNIQTNDKIVEYQTRFETAEKEKIILEQEISAKAKQNTIILLTLSLVALFVISILIYRALKLRNKHLKQEFELKEAISVIETQNKLQEQRLAISRDLHDNIGAQLTFVISSVDTLKYAFKITDEKINAKLGLISNFTKDTITELRDTIWAMNHDTITFEDIQIRISSFVEKAKIAQENVAFQFEIDKGLSDFKLTSVVGMNIYRIIQEGINNALKYAEPTQISITIQMVDNELTIIVKDNGKGFDTSETESGNGLRNMKKRADEINAVYHFSSRIGEGTKISLSVPPTIVN
ncbi:MAG TPA: sensor histidine kinase [Crocinitomicaceae bacterium]|nr:sensor histidine kinase [Crocinitomicaceae bacterium]